MERRHIWLFSFFAFIEGNQLLKVLFPLVFILGQAQPYSDDEVTAGRQGRGIFLLYFYEKEVTSL